MNLASSELFELSVPERIRLVEHLWDSLAKDAEAVPLTDWQRRESDACLDGCRAAPEGGESWAQVKADILAG
ncbi:MULTISPECIES: addiction module protein [Methylococcus]|uniref:Addiction module protein n=1 Tax=Methylococcus capsulatus TaxID=414 RepID=A0ABZ2FAJ2_METCP|nr:MULTISPECIES: addiction module protein [Methylococcus]MDF9391330.1 addiction module protein [Methylococcus capsulatus]